MTKVYLIRHAEAEGNYYRRIQGQWDGGITARGHKQIAALAERMKDVSLTALYSSDMTRTMLTAGAVRKYHDLPLQTDPRLREVYMGRWEGISWGDASYYEPEQYYAFSSSPDLWNVGDNELWDELQNRLYHAIADIAAKHEGESIAIVSHGTAIRALMCKIWNVAGKDIHSVKHGDNTSVSLLTVENGVISIDYACDSSHLPEDCINKGRQNWWKTGKDEGNLRFRPMDPKTDRAFYVQCYEDAWKVAHGDTEGFVPQLYLASALGWLMQDPNSIAIGLDGDTVVGLVALDPSRESDQNKGWIGFIYLLPQFRGQRYGVQLLGYATTYFSRKQRSHVRLSVSEDNPRAFGFYEHTGFRQYDEAIGIGAPLRLMERPIDKGVLPR